MSEPTRSWKDVLSDEPVNEKRAEIYGRLMEAQERVARVQYQRGTAHELVRAALDAADERLSELEQREDLYLSALGHYVEALGGRLELRAVFTDQEVLVWRSPDGQEGRH